MLKGVKFASQADLCYNIGRNIEALAVLETPRAVHLVRRCTMNTIPPSAGIYKITCAPTKKIYIGSAVNLQQRKATHSSDLRLNKHCNAYLQRAWNKYGERHFTFEVLELVLIPELLTAREQYWLDTLRPFGKKGYNLAPIAGSTLGLKFSPEARERSSQAKLGHKHTPERIEKNRQAQMGNKRALGYKHAPEDVERMRQSKQGKKNTLEHNENIRLARIGLKFSPEHRENIRRARSDQKPPFLGRKHTPETREKLRQSLLERQRDEKGRLT